MFDPAHPVAESKPAPSGARPSVADSLIPAEGVIDVAGSLQRMGGDLDLFCEFVGIYDEDAPPLTESIRRAIHRGDRASLHRAAHTLKGLVSNFGADRAAHAAYVLEKMGREDAPTSGDRASGGQPSDDLTRREAAVQALESELALLNEALAPFRTS